MEFKSVDEILDFAIKSEENAHRFYMDLSKRMEDKPMRKVFLELAGEESKHKVYFQELKEGKAIKLPSEGKIADLKITDYMVDPGVSSDMDYQDALNLAMKREKEAFKLYSGLAEMVEDEEMKKTFRVLADEEAKHKLRLEIMYDEEILTEN
jgi:rubrerythrin